MVYLVLPIPAKSNMPTNPIQYIVKKIDAVPAPPANIMATPLPRLELEHRKLDYFLGTAGGCLSYGQLIEWGIPWGCHGRMVIIRSILAEATRRHQWCLWVHDQEQLDIYPPAWQASGVDLRYLRVAACPEATTNSPMIELKAVFMSSFFKVIVVDCHLSAQDYMFLARRARQSGLLILVLRKHFLTPRLGNVWAKSRLNCWTEASRELFYLRMIKGPNQDNNPVCFSWSD